MLRWKRYFLVAPALLLLTPAAHANKAPLTTPTKTVEFASLDGLPITADLYTPHPPTAPLVLLFHQAGWSRGEYCEIAPILTTLGFNAMAIDQRAGGKVNDVPNRTAIRAQKKGKRNQFGDAYQDMKAALLHAAKNFQPKKLYLWGSSYSASLVFLLAADHPKLVSAVVAFSPNQNFHKKNGGANLLTVAKKVQVPVFVTSAKKERPMWQSLFSAIPGRPKISFIPESQGKHGSRALWTTSDGHDEYWNALRGFLSLIPKHQTAQAEKPILRPTYRSPFRERATPKPR